MARPARRHYAVAMPADVALTPLANIDERGVEARLSGSVVGFGATLALVVGMHWLGAPVWAFGLLMLPFLVAYELAYQGLFRT